MFAAIDVRILNELVRNLAKHIHLTLHLWPVNAENICKAILCKQMPHSHVRTLCCCLNVLVTCTYQHTTSLPLIRKYSPINRHGNSLIRLRPYARRANCTLSFCCNVYRLIRPRTDALLCTRSDALSLTPIYPRSNVQLSQMTTITPSQSGCCCHPLHPSLSP